MPMITYYQPPRPPAAPIPPVQPIPPVRRRRGLKLALAVCLAVLCVLGLRLGMPGKSVAQPHPVARPVRSAVQQRQAIATMDTRIAGVLSANPDVDISVSVVDLKTGAAKRYGPSVAYQAASVAKLITASAYLHQAEHGGPGLGQTLDDGNSAATDLKQMVVQSDNDAWQALNDQLTLDGLAAYAASAGINDYDLDDNGLTTDDVALLLRKLYQRQLLSSADTALLLGYMKNANEADYIPPVVPADATVYHKAGLLDDRVHDAAIIDDGRSPVALVVFTNGHGTYDFPARTQAIQTIAKAVLDGYDIR